MRRASVLLLLTLLFSSASLAGCTCNSKEVRFDLGLLRSDEIARTLPMLISGETTIGGLPAPIPDSHGYIDLGVRIPHPNITEVRASGLQVSLVVDHKELPVRLVGISGDSRWSEERQNRTWFGRLEHGETVRLWWTVDAQRTATATSLILAEGRPYALRVTFDWFSANICDFHASGRFDQTYEGVVRASVNAKAFRAAQPPVVDMKGNKVGFRANYTIQNGVTLNLDSSSAVVVALGLDGSIGAAALPRVSWTVNGLPGSLVKPGDALATFTTDTTNPTLYARPGTVVPTPPTKDRIVLVLQDLNYRPTDGSVGAVVDTFAFARSD